MAEKLYKKYCDGVKEMRRHNFHKCDLGLLMVDYWDWIEIQSRITAHYADQDKFKNFKSWCSTLNSMTCKRNELIVHIANYYLTHTERDMGFEQARRNLDKLFGAFDPSGESALWRDIVGTSPEYVYQD